MQHFVVDLSISELQVPLELLGTWLSLECLLEKDTSLKNFLPHVRLVAGEKVCNLCNFNEPMAKLGNKVVFLAQRFLEVSDLDFQN